MSVFLLSFGGIQKGGIHVPHLTPTLPWEQRWLALFLHGHCKLHAELPGKWWGAVCAIPGVYSECRNQARGHVGAGKSLGCMLSAVCKKYAYGKVLGFMLVVLAVEA